MVDGVSFNDDRFKNYSNIGQFSAPSSAGSLFDGQFGFNQNNMFAGMSPLARAILNGEDIDIFEMMLNNMMQQAFLSQSMSQQNFLSAGSGSKKLNNNYNNYSVNPYSFNRNYNTKTDLTALNSLYNPKKGLTLASVAEQNAQQLGTMGWCLKGVRTGLEKAGLDCSQSMGGSAYQAVAALDNNPAFKRVDISKQDLSKLPAGCVVVWDKSSGNQHGHIAVTLGDGKEASDHVQNVSQRDVAHTVYVPV